MSRETEPLPIHRDDIMDVVQECKDLERIATKLSDALWKVLDHPDDADSRFEAHMILRRYELWLEAHRREADA